MTRHILHTVAQLVVDEPDMDSLTKRLAEVLAGFFSAEQTFIAVMADDQLTVSSTYQQGRIDLIDLSFKPNQEITGWVMTHLRPFRSQNKQTNPPTISPAFAQQFPCEHVLAVPILNHQQHLLGVIECHRSAEASHFSDAELQLAQTIALIIAPGMERAKLLGRMQKWANSFQNLLAFSAALNEPQDIDSLMRRLVEHAAGFIGATAGGAGLVNDQWIETKQYWCNGAWKPFVTHWQKGAGLAGWVFANQCPYMTNTYPSDKLAEQRLSTVCTIHNAICIPILGVDETVLGFVELHNKEDGNEPFTWSDITFMNSLANSTAVALQNAQLLKQLEMQRTQMQALSVQQINLLEEERRRIARELHDEAGQALIGIKLGLQLLAHKIPPELAGLRLETDQLRQQVNHATLQIKTLAHALRPPILDELGLEVALTQCITEFQERTAIKVHFESIDKLPRLPQAVETVCYRIVQEALTNVARHAAARQVWVTLINDIVNVHLSIRDDGQGFDLARLEANAAGLGLLGMQERAKMLQGRMSVKSAEKVGTLIFVEIPLGALDAGQPTIDHFSR